MKKPEGAWALVICALGWSLGGIFLKYVNVNSFAIAGIRSLFAFIVMAAFSRYLPSFYVKDVVTKKIDKAQTVYLWLSALSYAATMIMYVIANKLTYAANVIFLQYHKQPVSPIRPRAVFIYKFDSGKPNYFIIIGL